MKGSSDVRKLVLGVAGIIVVALVFTQWTQASSLATVALRPAELDCAEARGQ